mgnify:CR=1 FL=1
MKKIKAGIIGATGYAGAELARLLVNHPDVEGDRGVEVVDARIDVFFESS